MEHFLTPGEGGESHHPEQQPRKFAHRVVVEEQQRAAAFPVLSSFPALPALGKPPL